MTTREGADPDTQLTRLAALGEPIRRLLYRFVANQPDPVSRDQAAEGIGVARHVAKFHLDKLAEDGLLDTDYRRPAGRSGPGAGRPTKLYRPAADEIAVSLPERHYDLAADILAQAVTATQQSGISIGEALHAAAHQTGARLGQSDTDRISDEATASAATICGLLADHGYEPVTILGNDHQARIMLRNCPFHRLAEAYPDLVCGLNLDLLSGILDSHPDSGLNTRLDPGPGRCCVTLTPATAPGS